MAARYWVGGTANWDTTAGTKWALTSGGAGGQAIPTSADDVFFDAASGAVTVSVSAAASCLTLNFTGYTGTFTINNGITTTVFGTAITLASGMTYDQTTTGILSTRGNQAAITITFAGITIPNLTIGRNTAGQLQTVTISGTTPTIKNLVITNGAANAGVILTGPAITITASLSNTLGSLTNSTGQIIFSGACTISSSASSATISGGFIVGSGSSLQMTSDVYLQTGTVTFSGGTLNAGAFTLFCPGIITFNTSTVTWYNVTLQATGQIYILSSVLNISNNLTISTTSSGVGFSGGFTINVSGSLLQPSGSPLGLSGILNMLGSGLIDCANISGGTLNINGTGTYTIGSATNPTLTSTGLTINLVGTSVAQVYSTTAHTLSTSGNLTLSTNNTPTGANIPGGSQIIWGNISLLSNQSNTITYNTTALGNLTSASATLNGVGRTLYVAGNLSVTTIIGGTATIELNGAVNKTWGAGTYQNNIIVNKSGGAIVTTAAGTITWGLANRTLTMNSPVNFLTNTTTFTLLGTPLTINDTFGNPFFNVNIPASALNINGGVMRINSNLTLTGTGATFAGAFGWDCNNLICSTAGTFNITLQELLTYRTRLAVSITGGLATAARPTITSSTSNLAIWTLDPGATQTLIYVNGTNINSSLGQTVWTFGGTISAATKNWNVGTRPGTSAYTFVN